MFPITLDVTCFRIAPSVYRLYCRSRCVGRGPDRRNDALYVSHAFTNGGRVVASLADAARWLERIEGVDAAPLAAA